MNRMRDRYGFTLIELLVVISIIALLLSILMPSLRKVKEQAKTVVCLSNLKQWSVVFEMYLGDNGEKFMRGWDEGATEIDDQWYNALRPYCDVVKLLLCPRAARFASKSQPGITWPQSQFEAWGAFPDPPGWQVNPGDAGSYGINAWLCNPEDNTLVYPEMEQVRWRTSRVSNASQIPVLFDSLWMDAWPESTDPVLAYEPDAWLHDWAGIGRFCIVRHPHGINMLFLDSHSEKTSLRTLWEKKWHREYDKSLGPDNFPKWMP